MKSLRKSLNSAAHREKDPHISSPLPSLSKPLTAIQPPKKVIRALGSYRAQAPQELSFEKGDFFHVTNDVVQAGQWYEAHNPISGARGLVPVSLFEEFSKGAATPKTPGLPPRTPASPKAQAFYAVVLHDFEAERADELEAKAGEAITVVAQSNREWFVAKPIGKLGRPGLIPVSFVEIRDPSTGKAVEDVQALIDGGALPPVEEWKRQIMSYKMNSISLGVLDENRAQQTASFAAAGQQLSLAPPTPATATQAPTPSPLTYQQPPPPEEVSPYAPCLPEGILLAAGVTSFHFEMDDYWFRVNATFQPYGQDTLPPAKELVLFRAYNDFYDFQVQILDTFPSEAGRDGSKRILPYMPGPAPHVDEEITATRTQELDEYLTHLCELRFSARHILEHRLIREFLAPKPGDAEQELEPRVDEIAALAPAPTQDDVDDHLSRMRLSNAPDSGYEENDYDSRGYGSRNSIDRHTRAGSVASAYKQPMSAAARLTHSRSSSRTNSYADRIDGSRSQSSLEIDPYNANAYSRSSLASSQPSPVRSSHAPSMATSASSRSRSHSNANTPQISASVPQTAFIKIKIFDKMTDDLVAIRVHPRVTHAQLMDKVQQRLGGNIHNLRYRDSMNNELVDLDGDDELRMWLDGTERHVLYAE